MKESATTEDFSVVQEAEAKIYYMCSILEHTAADGKVYKTKFYNLDAIGARKRLGL